MSRSEGRLICDPPMLGAWNMALDQAFLETADQLGLTTLRFYGWAKPTLSLGYFQNHASRRTHTASLECDIVRRASGGGAILHEHELTYSLSIPSSNRWSQSNLELYEIVHQCIIEQLAELGIHARLFGDDRQNDYDSHAFLCFQRRSSGDIVVDANKIVGSAQRRIRNSLLQHGSIIFNKSRFAPEIEGISNIAPTQINHETFRKELADRLADRLNLDLHPGEVSKSETESARSAIQAKFGNPNWIEKR